jgi:hypothetical protein
LRSISEHKGGDPRAGILQLSIERRAIAQSHSDSGMPHELLLDCNRDSFGSEPRPEGVAECVSADFPNACRIGCTVDCLRDATVGEGQTTKFHR